MCKISRIKRVLCLLTFLSVMLCYSSNLKSNDQNNIHYKIEQKKTITVGQTDTRPIIEIETLVFKEKPDPEEVQLLTQLVEVEAGNQNLTGKRYVVDVVLNRVSSDDFPDTVKEVIFQNGQFSAITDGNFEKAKKKLCEESLKAVLLEYEEQLNNRILYFSRGKSKYMKNNCFKEQDHWFGY